MEYKKNPLKRGFFNIREYEYIHRSRVAHHSLRLKKTPQIGAFFSHPIELITHL